MADPRGYNDGFGDGGRKQAWYENEGKYPPKIEQPSSNGYDDAVIGSPAIRGIFLGNLIPDCKSADVIRLFENSASLHLSSLDRTYRPFPVDHIDLKRGYCFVFLKDADSQSCLNDIEAFVGALNGISIPRVSNAIRVEFARGDGRIKRKEDERRRNITPCDTLFVVNFSEETTTKQDLEMLFEAYGELLRIDMRNNYAFVQFRTVEQATKAKEGTDGGRLLQSVITVEFVVRQQRDRDPHGHRGPPPPSSASSSAYRQNDGDDRRGTRYDDRVGSSGTGRGGSSSSTHPPADNYRQRRSSPPRNSDSNYRSDRDRPRSPARRSRSRSRSPPPRQIGRYNSGGGSGSGNMTKEYDNYPPSHGGIGGSGSGGGVGRYAPSPPSRRHSPPRGLRGSSPPSRGRGPSPPARGRGPSPPPRDRGSSPPLRGRGPSPPRRGPSPPAPAAERYNRGGDRDRGYRGAN